MKTISRRMINGREGSRGRCWWTLKIGLGCKQKGEKREIHGCEWKRETKVVALKIIRCLTAILVLWGVGWSSRASLCAEWAGRQHFAPSVGMWWFSRVSRWTRSCSSRGATLRKREQGPLLLTGRGNDGSGQWAWGGRRLLLPHFWLGAPLLAQSRIGLQSCGTWIRGKLPNDKLLAEYPGEGRVCFLAQRGSKPSCRCLVLLGFRGKNART